MLLSVKMYLSSLKERQTSTSCRSKQRRDKLLERRRSAGSQLNKPQITKTPRTVSCHLGLRTGLSARKPERAYKSERLLLLVNPLSLDLYIHISWNSPSGKHVCEMYTPLNPTFI